MIRRRKPTLRNTKPKEIRVTNFKKGLNKLLSPTKIQNEELAIAKNVIIIEDGVVAVREGTHQYVNEHATDFFSFYNKTGDNHIIFVDTSGNIKKLEDNHVVTTVSGATLTAGVRSTAVMAQNKLYISNGTDDLTVYDGSSLSRFASLNAPSSLSLTRGTSLLSGVNTYYYKVTATNSVGETLASTQTVAYTNIERTRWSTLSAISDVNYAIRLAWAKVTGATGYHVYGVTSGTESYIDRVEGENTLQYYDYGDKQPSLFFSVPTGNTTTAPKGRFITEVDGSLIITGDTSNPSRVWYSAGSDKVASFLIGDGGGYVDIGKDSEDGKITGVAGFQNKMIIGKERSVWSADFTEAEIPSVGQLTTGLGLASHRTFAVVENDLFFLGKKTGGLPAIYSIGYEPNFQSILRTNEVSVRIRPLLQALTEGQVERTSAVYYNGKYYLSYAQGGSTNNTIICYDRERASYTEWEGVKAKSFLSYTTEANKNKFLFIDEANSHISIISSDYTSDKGHAINWKISTKEFDFDDPFLVKRFREIAIRFRNLKGNVKLTFSSGITTLFSTVIQGENYLDTSFASGKFGVNKFGTTVSGGVATLDFSIIKRLILNGLGHNAIQTSLQVSFEPIDVTSRLELLDLLLTANLINEDYYNKNQNIII